MPRVTPPPVPVDWDALPEWLNAEQVAPIFGKCARTIQEWWSDGALPSCRVGRAWGMGKAQLRRVLGYVDAAPDGEECR